MGQRAESMEQHRGELYDQYQRKEEDEHETDWLELQVLLRDVHLQNCTCIERYFWEATPDDNRNLKRNVYSLDLIKKIKIIRINQFKLL